jgi:lysophospholipase L1-like esterase
MSTLVKRRRYVFLLATATVVPLIVLASLGLALEGFTRVSYYFFSRRFIHPYLGETQKPFHRRTDYTPDGEAFVFTSNNYGFRGSNIPDQKPVGARYIFALGGSTTACNEYPHERTWPGVLERRLRRDLNNDQGYVFNAGMGSGTSFRSLNLFLNVITRLSPDLVILYEGVNDKPPLYPTSARYFREIGRGEAFLHRPSYFLYELALHTRNSALTELVRWLSSPPLERQGFEYHEKNYRDIAHLARGYAIPLLFVTQPTMPEAENNSDINDSTRRLGRALNVDVFDLAAIMPLDYKHFLPDGVHYTEHGNRWIGDRLARWFVDHAVN